MEPQKETGILYLVHSKIQVPNMMMDEENEH